MSVRNIDGADPRALVVDDNATNRDLLARQLSRLGWVSDPAPSARRALELLEAADYAVVLTDLRMPDIDGFELARAIRQGSVPRIREIPVFAVSANMDNDVVGRCLAAGMDGCLGKPVDRGALRDVMDRVRAGRTGGHQAGAAVDGSGAAPASQAAKSTTLDLDALREIVGDDDIAIREVLEHFVTHARRLADDINAAIAAADFGGVERVAHQLKSPARGVGAFALGELCQQLERAGAAGEWSRIGQLAPLVDAALLDLIRAAEEASSPKGLCGSG